MDTLSHGCIVQEGCYPKRVIALDIGEKRVGIASSDLDGQLAFPVDVLSTDEVIMCSSSFLRIVDDYEPELLVVGLPLSLSGEENLQAEHIRTVAQKVSKECNLPVEFVDERYSSKEAKRVLRDMGIPEKQARGRIDMIAASLFLQTWLDLHVSN